MKNKKKFNISLFLYCVSAFCLVITIVFLLYPTVSNWLNEKNSSKAVASYNDTVNNLNEEEIEKVLNEAREYNRKLLYNSNRF